MSQRSMQDFRLCSSKLKRMESVLEMSRDFCLCMACSRFFLVLSSLTQCRMLSCRALASRYSDSSISPNAKKIRITLVKGSRYLQNMFPESLCSLLFLAFSSTGWYFTDLLPPILFRRAKKVCDSLLAAPVGVSCTSDSSKTLSSSVIGEKNNISTALMRQTN